MNNGGKDTKKILSLTQYENQWNAKHVESLSATCLDAGSTPANSTMGKVILYHRF